MKDDTLADVHPTRVVLPFKPKEATPEVTPPNPDAAVITLFEQYLESAKQGKIKFAAVAAVDNRGVAFTTWEPCGGENAQLNTQALGAVAFLNHRFNAACDEGADIDPSLRG